MGKIYALMSLVSVLIRQFALPNPFECFGESAALINWIAEPIMHVVAYGIVGMFYSRGSAPLLGSIAYLLTYTALTGVLWIMGIFSFSWWWILIIIVAIIALICGCAWLKERFL